MNSNTSGHTAISLGRAAKQIGMTRKELTSALKARGLLTANNQPHGDLVRTGLFITVTFARRQRTTGERKHHSVPYVTHSGLAWINEIINEQKSGRTAA